MTTGTPAHNRIAASTASFTTHVAVSVEASMVEKKMRPTHVRAAGISHHRKGKYENY